MRVIIALCSFLALSSTLPQLAEAELDISDRAALDSIIKEFIQNNPEVLRDTLIALAAREETERKQAGLSRLRDDQGDPVMGNPDGAIKLYEFSDYNCGYCKRVFEPIQQMLRDNPDVRLVIKEFPILSQSSLVAAQAAIAAEMQGKFADYHIGMMTYRGQITNDVVMRVAEQAGLDNKQLQKDMESAKTAAIIQRTREAAAALALNGTPALVIGDTVVPGAISLDELVRLVADERAKQG
jgi:protein-disulfide isomerase